MTGEWVRIPPPKAEVRATVLDDDAATPEYLGDGEGHVLVAEVIQTGGWEVRPAPLRQAP